MNAPVFVKGQVVVATHIEGYRNHLTEGKEYVVVEYDPPCRVDNYTFSAYVTVVGDLGKYVICRAHRFAAKQGTS